MRSFGIPKTIPYAPYGFNIILSLAQFAAQAADMHVDGPVNNELPFLPDIVQDLLP